MSLLTDFQPLPAGSAFVEDDLLSVAGLVGDETGLLVAQLSDDGQQILALTYVDFTAAVGENAYDDRAVKARLGETTAEDPAAPLSALSGLVSGAPQWVAGQQKAGALVFNAGFVYRVKQDIANGQAAPAATNPFYLKLPVYDDPRHGATTDADPAAPLSALGWVVVGTPGRGNVGLAPLGTGTTLPTDSRYNVFGFGINGCTFGSLMFFNTFGSVQNNHVLGSGFEGNFFGPGCDDVRFGSGAKQNWLNARISLVRAGNNCVGNRLTALVDNVTLGNSVVSCYVGPGCQYVSLGDNCQRVELYHCTGTQGAPFTVPAGTTDAVYRNNVLQVGGGSGTPGTARDPYDVPATKRKAVVDAGLPLVTETDEAYYGKKFGDDVYGPDQPAKYECIPFAPAQDGGATIWKWARTEIL